MTGFRPFDGVRRLLRRADDTERSAHYGNVRLAEILGRYRIDSIVDRFIRRAEPELCGCAQGRQSRGRRARSDGAPRPALAPCSRPCCTTLPKATHGTPLSVAPSTRRPSLPPRSPSEQPRHSQADPADDACPVPSPRPLRTQLAGPRSRNTEHRTPTGRGYREPDYGEAGCGGGATASPQNDGRQELTGGRC